VRPAGLIDPSGFAEYVRLARRSWRMLGPPRKTVQAIERDVPEAARQSLTATRDLPAGPPGGGRA